ncbi:MAG: hypothetical protein H7A46_19705 [Verrucomicrobiales bacterium]|nr:hypothetical protein [Verrucomicrobiales bacterium]
MGSSIAYLAQGRIWIKPEEAAARLLESPYANGVHERAARSHQRHAWKSQGNGFLSGGTLWGQNPTVGPQPVLFTSLSPGTTSGGLVYSLASGPLCALCESADLATDERRVWNDNRVRAQYVHACPATGNLACSVHHENGTAAIGVMLKDRPGFSEVTEGDSVDTAPHWVPGDDRRIVFQSAGVGRNRDGQAVALGPFSIQLVDIDTGHMETLVEDPTLDCLAPQILGDGTLYYIRRPYNEHARVKPLRALKDTLLFPFRLLYAVFQFFNSFSMMFTGRKLSTPAGTPHRELELKRMMIWGNLIEAQRDPGEDEGIGLVPGSWQLVRRSPESTEEVLAKGVLAYDVGDDGTIAYTNGNAIFLRRADTPGKRIHTAPMIEQVVLLR